ncbi:chitin deacetylase, partial [Linnemannia zychae]
DVALKELIGKRPVYMRPPYGNTSPSSLEYLGEKGYKVINWNVDTDDWQHPLDFKVNFQAYKNALQTTTTGKSFISLQHDAEPGTAQVFSKLAIEYVLSKGFNVMPVGECLGDPVENWYRD